MTGEEVERAIEFILQSRATLEEQVRRSSERTERVNRDLGERIAETNRVVRMQADTQTQFIQVVTK